MITYNMNTIQIIKDIATIGAASVASAVAILGLTAWKNNLKVRQTTN